MDLEATIDLIRSFGGRTISVTELDPGGHPGDAVTGVLARECVAEDAAICGLPFVRFSLDEGRAAFVLPRVGFVTADQGAQADRIRIRLSYCTLDIVAL